MVSAKRSRMQDSSLFQASDSPSKRRSKCPPPQNYSSKQNPPITPAMKPRISKGIIPPELLGLTAGGQEDNYPVTSSQARVRGNWSVNSAWWGTGSYSSQGGPWGNMLTSCLGSAPQHCGLQRLTQGEGQGGPGGGLQRTVARRGHREA